MNNPQQIQGTDHGKTVLMSAVLDQRDELERMLIFARNYIEDSAGMPGAKHPRTDRMVVAKIDATLRSVFGKSAKTIRAHLS